MTNTAKDLYEELNKDYKPNKKRPELGEFCTLKRTGDSKVEFSIGWFNLFTVQFNPKTIGVKINVVDKKNDTHWSISKQLPLDQDNLLDTILDIYVKECNKHTK